MTFHDLCVKKLAEGSGPLCSNLLCYKCVLFHQTLQKENCHVTGEQSMVFTQVHIMKYVYNNLFQYNLTRLNISSFQKGKSSTYQTQTDNCREQEPKKRSESHCLVDCVGHLVGFDKLDSVNLLCLTAECEQRMKVLLQ